jgi:hypothetical protein
MNELDLFMIGLKNETGFYSPKLMIPVKEGRMKTSMD